MKIYQNLGSIEPEKCVLTLGTFDGVHLGHQSIIRRLCEIAGQAESCSTVVTFEPHPQFVLKPDIKPKLRLLTTLEEKIAFMDNAGIDRLIIIPFTESFARLSSETFIKEILVGKIGFTHIIIGYDHAFGRGRSGNIDALEKLKSEFGYRIIKMPPFSIDDVIISSTKIRKLLAEGNVNLASTYLGYRYQLNGLVIKGEGRGRNYATPTANLRPLSENKLIPQNGIYAGWALHRGERHKAVIYIGVKPT
ncbi:MAG: bifunctional riboflavin kinase/FMN adenylyltransferase, partial [bacterium]|nr:bifunctional riboflavin kinase/FMN adenylyltransferase [bacterium]